MKICPKCKRKYPDTKQVCKKCKAQLVPEKAARPVLSRRFFGGVLLAAGVGVLCIVGAGSALFSRGSARTLEQIQAQRLILDDHEHIQSLNEVPRLLKAMDRLGIQRVALMASSYFTLTLNPAVGFTRYDENNEELLKICEKYPGRFEAWPTTEPHDPRKLEKFKDFMARGATGLKLYLGHGYIYKKKNEYMFHTAAIDDPAMFPLYEYCETNGIPVDLHVNPGPTRPGFAQEFVAMLERFPDLKVICPHFMLSTIHYMRSTTADSRLEQLLDTFPNLYTDTSFGHDDFLVPGLKRLSKAAPKFRALFRKYPTRIFYSADLVVTEVALRIDEWVYIRLKAYLDMLSKDTYTTPLIPGETLNGLALPPDLLERVLYKNYEDFLASKPKNTRITRKINWARMGSAFVKRTPGQAFPPPKAGK